MKATLIRNTEEMIKMKVTLFRNTKEIVKMKGTLIRNTKEIVKLKKTTLVRYKSLCLSLLAQLKKMHIQLPILYVVKVPLSSCSMCFADIFHLFVQNNLFTISTLLEDKEMALMWAKDLLKWQRYIVN